MACDIVQHLMEDIYIGFIVFHQLCTGKIAIANDVEIAFDCQIGANIFFNKAFIVKIAYGFVAGEDGRFANSSVQTSNKGTDIVGREYMD